MERNPSLPRSYSEASDLSSQFEGDAQKQSHKRNAGDNAGDEVIEDDNGADFSVGVFGVIYTVSREKKVPMVQVGFKLALDVLQLLLLTINPTYGWSIDGDSTWWYVISFVGLNKFMSDRGITFFLVCLYIFVFLLLMTAALCVWVAYSFKGNKFDYVWPITFLRWFSNIFFQILDIASMTLFLIPLDCTYTVSSPELRFYNQEFPTMQCWSMPFMIHVAVSALSIILFVAMATLFQMGDMETDPATKNPLAMGHSRVEVIGFLTRFFMTACSVFINNLRWLSICYIFGSVVLVYLYVKWVPHYVAWVNYIRCASYGAVLYSAVCMAVLTWQTGADTSRPDGLKKWADSCTIALVAGLVPAALLFGGAGFWRLRYLLVNVVEKFRFAVPEADTNLIHEFSDPREVEICARVLRKWMRTETGAEVLDADAVELADTIVKVGTVQFKGNAYMYILHASFLADVRKSLQSSILQLTNAKKSQPSFLERFAIYSREQQQVQSDAHGSDLLSYVQMQRNLRLATKVYRDALLAMSDFWQMLLRHEVQFEELLKCVKAVDVAVSSADAVYKDMLQSTVDNWRILKVYAKFVEVIKNDPWAAAKWNGEADELCRAEEENQQNLFKGSGNNDRQVDEKAISLKAAFDSHLCCIIINSFGIITMANKAAFSLFGCKPTDLIGKNVKMLMPSPFKEHHDQYIKAVADGKGKRKNGSAELVAQNADGHCFAVRVTVSKVSGSGMDSSYMGVVEAIKTEGVAKAWALADGTLLSVDSSVVQWLGYAAQDMCGNSIQKYIADTVTQEAALRVGREAITTTKHRSPDLSRRQSVDISYASVAEPRFLEGVAFTHKYLDQPVVCDVTVTSEGGQSLPFLIYSIARTSTPQPVMVCDATGRISHVCDALAESFGSSVKQILQQGNLLSYVPEAIAQLHMTYLMRNTDGADCPPYSCRSGLSVALNVTGASGSEIQPFQIKIKRKVDEVEGSMVHVMTMNKRTIKQALEERCLSVLVDINGTVRKVSSPDATLFGFAPSDLLNTSISSFIDVMGAGDGDVQDIKQLASTMKALVTRSVQRPGCSFRVGVLPPTKTGAMDAFLGGITSHLRSAVKKAAVMKVTLHFFNQEVMRLRTEAGGQTATDSFFDLDDVMAEGLGTEPGLGDFMVELQLWKADLLTGVINLDDQGMITSSTLPPLYASGLIFGTSNEAMLKKHISSFLPIGNRPITDLFDPVSDAKVLVSQKRGGMKVAKDALAARKAPGVVNIMHAPHATDGRELALRVQALVLRSGRPTMALIVRLSNPEMGMPNFQQWLLGTPSMTKAPPHTMTPPPQALAPPDVSKARLPEVPRMPPQLGDDLPACDTPPVPGPPALTDMVMSIKKKKKKKVSKSQRTSRRPSEAGDTAEGGGPEDARGSGEDAEASPLPGELPVAPSLENLDKLLGNLQQHELKSRPGEGHSGSLVADADKPRCSPLVETPPLRNPLSPKPPSPLERIQPEPATLIQKLRSGSGDSRKDRVMAWMQMENTSAPVPQDAELEPDDAEWHLSTDASETRNMRDVDDIWAPLPRKQAAPDDDAASGSRSESGALQQSGFAQAGSAADYKRAKRLKRLTRLLMGSAARQIINRFFFKAGAMAAFVLMVTLACFIAAYSLILGQSGMVKSIQRIGFAANAMAKVAIEVNYLVVLFGNNTHPSLVGLQKFDDIYLHLDRLYANTIEFKDLHQESYRYIQELEEGSSEAADALVALWEHPQLPITTTLPSLPVGVSETVNATLWDAGQTIINKALIVWSNTPKFPANVINATTFDEWYDVRYILDNTQDTLIPAYTEVMNKYLTIVLSRAASVNAIHYYFLVIEGCVCSFIALVFMLVVTTQVVLYRWNVYNIFLLVPTAVIRGLASRLVALLEDGVGDEQGGTEGERHEEPPADPGFAKSGQYYNAQEGFGKPVINLADKAIMEDMSVWGILKSTWDSMAFWKKSRVHASPLLGKRNLVRSSRLIVLFMLPFGIWGLMMIVINVVAHKQLSMVDSPIALFNLVNFNLVQFYRFQVFLQELTIEPDPSLMPEHRMYIANSLPLRFSDYTALLYGRDAVNDSRAHISHVREGLVSNAFGKHILFETTECLRLNQSSCIAPNHRLHGYTTHGLDALFNRYWEVLRIDLSDGGLAPWFDSAEFEFVDQTYPDIEGGLIQLCLSYYQSVIAVYQNVMQTHIVGLIITIILMAGFLLFILWPFVSACKNEGRRIADLLSQVPSDIDIESLVKRALLGSQPGGNPSNHSGGATGSRRGSVVLSGKERVEKSSPSTLAAGDDGFFRPTRQPSRTSKGDVRLV